MSEATSAAGAPSANVFRPPTAMIPGATPSSASNVSQAFQFSSGNPRIEETRGFMHLYRNDFASSKIFGTLTYIYIRNNKIRINCNLLSVLFCLVFSRFTFGSASRLRGNGVYWFALCFMVSDVCRYCQQQPEKSICFVCQTSENLWICVICGFVGCGRYKEGHSIRHWKETQHCYSLELDTQRVWDYAGDNYVHRLIQSKTDRKLVELNHYCAHADDGCGSCNCSIDTGFSETLLNSKVENQIVNEYSELLTTQLENQKIYFESLLQEVEEETEREISEAIEKAATGNQKLQKMQAKLDKCDQEKSFFDEVYFFVDCEFENLCL
ncbi:hypothetical protein CsSME_00052557 [Camellia sinensis var. sinensis]